jgi:hypothetical protein
MSRSKPLPYHICAAPGWKVFVETIRQDPIEFAGRIHHLAVGFLRLAEETNGGKVEFDRANVWSGSPTCNTVACHGGWACYIDPVGCQPRTLTEVSGFTSGIRNIQAILGLPYTSASELFDKREKLWGNRHGGLMFTAAGWISFGYDHEHQAECDLYAIAEHWASVALRIIDNVRYHSGLRLLPPGVIPCK